MQRSLFRGHPILLDKTTWVYEDTREPVSESWKERHCGFCGKGHTEEEYDGCLGFLPNVMNACCGHGIIRDAYIQYWNGTIIYGSEAIDVINCLKKETFK